MTMTATISRGGEGGGNANLGSSSALAVSAGKERNGNKNASQTLPPTSHLLRKSNRPYDKTLLRRDRIHQIVFTCSLLEIIS